MLMSQLLTLVLAIWGFQMGDVYSRTFDFETDSFEWNNLYAPSLEGRGGQPDMASRMELCSFNDPCPWIDEDADNIDKIEWIRTNIGHPQLGPVEDATGNDEGYFMLADATGGIDFARAVLIYRDYVSQVFCFSFSYYINGVGLQLLGIGIKPDGANQVSVLHVVADESNNVTNGTWIQHSVRIEDLVNNEGSVFFYFVVKGSNVVAAIDEISIDLEECPICPNLMSPLYGEVNVSWDEPPSATYKCNDGFLLLGMDERTCLNGTWSGQKTVCSKPCPDQTPPKNGFLEYVDRYTIDGVEYNLFDTRVVYKCNSGYELVGEASRSCRKNGEFGKSAPTCQVQGTCPRLSNPSNGRVNHTSCAVDDVATYTCNDGYVLIGTSERTCTDDGSWNGTEPTCNRTCPDQDPPENGSLEYVNRTSINGVEYNFYDTKVVYECNPGYELVGQKSRTCWRNGYFGGSAPTCQIEGSQDACPPLSNPTNGQVYHSSCAVDAVANYTCNEGYVLIGTNERTCTVNGTWNGTEPMCNRTCPDQDPPENGSLEYVDRANINGVEYNVFATRVVYKCNSGYELVGEQSRSCRMNGEFGKSAPTCEEIQPTCPPLSNPTHGQVAYSSRDVDAEATYTCNEGYVLMGTNKRICTDDGTWDGTEPTCKRTCPPLSNPTHGKVTYSSLDVDAEATYTCNEGYVLIGTNERTCTDDGSWDGTQPTCNRTNCGPLEAPENGEVEVNEARSIATYSCNPNFQLTGNETRVCLNTNTWSGVAPSCQQVCMENGTINPNFTGPVVVRNPAPEMFRHALSFDNTQLCTTTFSSDNQFVELNNCLMKDVIIAFHNETDGLDVIIGGNVIVMHAYNICEKSMYGLRTRIGNNVTAIAESYIVEGKVDVNVTSNMRLESPTGPVTISGVIGQEIYWTVDIPAFYHAQLLECTAYPGTQLISTGTSKRLITDGCSEDLDLVASWSTDKFEMVGPYKRYYTSFYPFKFYFNDYITITCSIRICNRVYPENCDFTCNNKRSLRDVSTPDDSESVITTSVTMKVVDHLLQSGANPVIHNTKMLLVTSLLVLLFVR